MGIPHFGDASITWGDVYFRAVMCVNPLPPEGCKEAVIMLHGVLRRQPPAGVVATRQSRSEASILKTPYHFMP